MVARCSCLQIRRNSTCKRRSNLYGLGMHYKKSTSDKIKRDCITKYAIIHVLES